MTASRYSDPCELDLISRVIAFFISSIRLIAFILLKNRNPSLIYPVQELTSKNLTEKRKHLKKLCFLERDESFHIVRSEAHITGQSGAMFFFELSTLNFELYAMLHALCIMLQGSAHFFCG
jgi:hypothetical protein